jgi:HemY protein
MALASGEGHLAMTKAQRADKLLKQPQLTNLLTAQAAEMTGDTKKAEETYKKLLDNDKTRFVGVRGIMKQKLAEGDTDTALKLAEKAFALKPKHEETQDVLLKLQADKADWKGARATLGAKLKSGNLPRDVHKRRDAVLALSEAKDVFEEGNSIEAREAAIEANRLSPDLIPAAVMAARGYIEAGNARYAARVLTKTWGASPHPDIAAAFAEIEPDETPAARIKRFKALIKQTPNHPETKMLLAELNIAAEDFPAAKRALGDLNEADPTSRSLTLMAAIERGQGADDVVVRGWLARALTAPRGPQWVCETCGNVHAVWGPTCGNCGSFDTLAWKTPPAGEVAMPSGTEMLPLIVGQIADNSDDVVDAEVINNEDGK